MVLHRRQDFSRTLAQAEPTPTASKDVPFGIQPNPLERLMVSEHSSVCTLTRCLPFGDSTISISGQSHSYSWEFQSWLGATEMSLLEPRCPDDRCAHYGHIFVTKSQLHGGNIYLGHGFSLPCQGGNETICWKLFALWWIRRWRIKLEPQAHISV